MLSFKTLSNAQKRAASSHNHGSREPGIIRRSQRPRLRSLSFDRVGGLHPAPPPWTRTPVRVTRRRDGNLPSLLNLQLIQPHIPRLLITHNEKYEQNETLESRRQCKQISSHYIRSEQPKNPRQTEQEHEQAAHGSASQRLVGVSVPLNPSRSKHGADYQSE